MKTAILQILWAVAIGAILIFSFRDGIVFWFATFFYVAGWLGGSASMWLSNRKTWKEMKQLIDDLDEESEWRGRL